jgi:SHS2 domain-containing protein
MTFEYLPHTADVKIRAKGETPEEAFLDAAKALAGLLVQGEVQSADQHTFTVTASSLQSLLLEFLDELIYLKDTKHFVVADAELRCAHHGESWVLEGTLLGDHIANYEQAGDVKAATMHKLVAKESDDGVLLEFVLDI